MMEDILKQQADKLLNQKKDLDFKGFELQLWGQDIIGRKKIGVKIEISEMNDLIKQCEEHNKAQTDLSKQMTALTDLINKF